MLEVVNGTPFAADVFYGWSVKREPSAAVVVKAAFRFDLRGEARLLPRAVPIELTDRFAKDPLASGLVACDESVIEKQGAEILLLGAVARPAEEGRRVMEVSAGLRFPDGSEWSKTLRVHGVRRYEKGLLGLRISEPEPLDATPLIYENAYGGTDPEDPDDDYPPNPVGKGYCRSWRKATGLELPAIEQGPKWIASPRHRPLPAGFGPLASHWEPRLTERGTPDETAPDTGACAIGADALPGFYNCAPLDQRFPRPFCGGETLSLTNLVPGSEADRPVAVTLPTLLPKATLILGARRTELPLRCDTLIIYPENQEAHMIFRATLPWSPTDRRTVYVLVQDDSLAQRTGEEQLQVRA